MRNMPLSLAVAIASLAAIVLPATARAYLSPEQVFGGQMQDSRPAPMTQREGEAEIAERPLTQREGEAEIAERPLMQREGEAEIVERPQRTADWREQQQSELTPVDAEPEDTYVPEMPQPPNLPDENVQYEKPMERIQEKNAQGGPTIVVAGNGTVIDSKGNVLHSGAPIVTSTGPATFLGIAAMLLAAASTFTFSALSAHRLRQ